MVAAATLGATLFTANWAWAYSEQFYFKLPTQALSGALIRFAVQARTSVSMQALGHCKPHSNPVDGHFSVGDGLSRLLAGTGCDFRVLDGGAVLVFAGPAPKPAPALQPAMSVPRAPIAPSSGPVVVEALIVTSGQRPALLDRAPYSVSVMSGDVISDSGAGDLGGLAPTVGSATLTDLGPGRNKIFLRGLADSVVAGRTQSTVGIYLDGARITYNAPDPSLRLIDIDRVEVLRGPQGALYGAGSIGGVVETVTRRPALDAFAAQLDLGGAWTVGGSAGRSIDAMFNLPLVTDKLGLRVVAYDEIQGGYLNNPVLGLKNVNEVQRQGFRVASRWQASSDWSLTANVTRQTLSAQDGQYANPLVGARSRDTAIQEPHGGDFTAFGLTLVGRRPWGDLSATSSYVRQTQTSRFDATLAAPLFTSASTFGPSPFDQSDTSKIFVNEISVTSAAAGKLRWLGGLFQSLTDNDSVSTFASPIVPGEAPVAIYVERRSDQINEVAAYGELSYLLAPKLVLSAGGRLFGSWSHTQSTVTQPVTNDLAAFDGNLAATGFAPQVVVRYRPLDDFTLYILASEGYRSGGFNTAGLPDQAFSQGVPALQPWRRYGGDELWNFETGAKFGLLKNAARVRIAAFYMLWRNIQSDQLLADGLPYTANIGDGRDVGLEGDVDFRPDSHWRIRLNGAVAKPEITRPNPTFVANPGFGLSGSWNYWGSLQVSYHHNLSPALQLRLMASCDYIGGANLTLDAATAAEDSTDVATGQLTAQVVHANWTLSVFARAPITGGADTFGFGNPFSFRTIDQTTPARPATFGLDLKLSLP